MDTMIWLVISEYPQVVIATNPDDAIICPLDSVLITTNTNLIQYWVGPDGNIPPTPGLFYSQTPGFYYAVADYGPDCNVVSNTVELIQYNTPYLLASPYGVICNGDPVTLTVQTTEGSVVNWLPPLSGSALTQTITDIGIYTCSINACDIYTEISMDIIIDSMDLFIESDDLDLTFCPSDSLLLYAPDNLATYQWQSPVSSNNQMIYVSEPGTYSVIGTSGSGCRDTTQINVNMFDEYPSIFPMEDTTICAKETALVHATSNDLIYWSTSNVYNNAFTMGNAFTTEMLYYTDTFYVYSATENCQTEIFPVIIHVDRHCREIEIPNIITPNGDGHNDCFPSDRYDYGLDLAIYNRWGKLIYSGEKIRGGWKGDHQNGRKISDGTYFYILTATFFDGTKATYQGEVMVLDGHD
jgi:gliding motility-associated-like protein